jgi:periplasmic protein TonB
MATLTSPPKQDIQPTKEATRKKRVEYELPLHGFGSEAAVVTHEIPFRLFSEALLEMSTTRPGRRTFDFIASIFIHAMFLGTLLMIPLYFTEGIDLTQFTRTLLVAPPPPPPPPPAAPAVVKQVVAIKRVFMHAGKLMAPSAIPQKIAMIKEEQLPPDLGGEGVIGGVPGGVPGGQMGGVIGGIIAGAQERTFIPAPRAPMPTLKAPLRVGGRVKPPRPISTPPPVYPQLAKMGRIEGEVIIDTVIDAEGNVVQLKALSGPPLLIPAALEAVSKWKYEPTYLNEQPVPVSMTVIVRFHLE